MFYNFLRCNQFLTNDDDCRLNKCNINTTQIVKKFLPNVLFLFLSAFKSSEESFRKNFLVDLDTHDKSRARGWTSFRNFLLSFFFFSKGSFLAKSFDILWDSCHIRDVEDVEKNQRKSAGTSGFPPRLERKCTNSASFFWIFHPLFSSLCFLTEENGKNKGGRMLKNASTKEMTSSDILLSNRCDSFLGFLSNWNSFASGSFVIEFSHFLSFCFPKISVVSDTWQQKSPSFLLKIAIL